MRTVVISLAVVSALALDCHPCLSQSPVSQAILGKWKSLEIKEDATLEFLKDGKLRIAAQEITIDGSYKFTDESTMEVTIVIGGKENVLKLKVKLEGDMLTTQEIGKEKTERFRRVK
jgi:uncharacterized protein (TIGR03066 family)